MPATSSASAWMTGPSAASFSSRTTSRLTRTTCCAACLPTCRRTIRRWTAFPMWCPPRTGPSGKFATWWASSRSAIPTRSGWSCRTAGRRACIRSAKMCRGITCPRASTTSASSSSTSRPKAARSSRSGRSIRRSMSRRISGCMWKARWCAAASIAGSWCIAASRSSPNPS